MKLFRIEIRTAKDWIYSIHKEFYLISPCILEATVAADNIVQELKELINKMPNTGNLRVFSIQELGDIAPDNTIVDDTTMRDWTKSLMDKIKKEA